MKVLIQKTKEASCTVDGKITGAIESGLCLFVGFDREDREDILPRMAEKVLNLRIFLDDEGKMNRSLLQAGGSILSISQFTLYASCKKGNRPSFIQAASGENASILYDKFNAILAKSVQVEKGIFGADMKIRLLNDGPITIMLDSDEVIKK